jgi:hypothetical protein
MFPGPIHLSAAVLPPWLGHPCTKPGRFCSPPGSGGAAVYGCRARLPLGREVWCRRHHGERRARDPAREMGCLLGVSAYPVTGNPARVEVTGRGLRYTRAGLLSH